MFKKITSMLSPSQPIGVTPKKDNNYIEGAAQQTANTEMSTANTANQKAQAINNISGDISSIAKTALNISTEYSTNLYYNLLTQAKESHSNTSNAIKLSNNPDVIAQASSTNSAKLLGLKNASKSLLPGQRDAINSTLDSYGQAGIQQATLKNSEIHNNNLLNTAINGRSSELSGWDIRLSNTEDPKERKKIFNEVSSQMQHLENIKPFLTTNSQVNKLNSLVHNLTAWAYIKHQPIPNIPSMNVATAMNESNAMVIKRNAAVTNGISDIFHGGKVRDTSEIDFQANPDMLNLYNAKMKAKILTNSLGNSQSITQDSKTLNDSDDYVSNQIGKMATSYIKNGEADKLAYTMSPDVKAAADKLATSNTSAEQSENSLDYQQKLKSWMNSRGLPDSAYNPITQEHQNFIHSFSNAPDTPENLTQSIVNTNMIYKMSGETHKTIFGGTSDSAMLRNIRFLEHDKNGNVSNPQETANIIRSYSPIIQKDMNSDKLTFTSEDSTPAKYESASGNNINISNSQGLLTYVSQNSSSFNINKLSTLTGNSQADLIKSSQTQVYLKMKKGEDMTSAINDVKSNNLNMLREHPVYAGSSTGGSTYSINPDIGSTYGLADVDKSLYGAILGKVNDDIYNKAIHRNNLVVGKVSDNKQINEKYTASQNIERNKQYLGDKDESHIYSSNGRLWVRYQTGITEPITAHDVSVVADKKTILKAKIDKATSAYAASAGLPEAARAWM